MASITLSPSEEIFAGESLTITVSGMIYGGTNSSTDYWRITVYEDGSSRNKYTVPYGTTNITKYCTVPSYACSLSVEAKLYVSGVGWTNTTTEYIEVIGDDFDSGDSGDSGSGDSGSGSGSSYNPTIGYLSLYPIYNDGTNASNAIQGITKIQAVANDCYAVSGNISYYVFSSPYETKTVYTKEQSAEVIFEAPKGSGSLSYSVSVYNSYGRSCMMTRTLNVYNYSAPYFTNFNAYRSDASGVADIGGSYISYEYNVSYSGTDSVTVTVYCGNETKTATGLSGKGIMTNPYSPSLQYNLYAVVKNRHGASNTSATISVYPSGKILNIASDGKSMGVGGVAPSTSGTLQCYWDLDVPKLEVSTNFESKGTTIIGDSSNDVLTVKSSSSFNSKANFKSIEVASESTATFYKDTVTYKGGTSEWKFPEIETGKFTVSPEDQSYITNTIPFKKTFSGTPTVCVQCNQGNAYLNFLEIYAAKASNPTEFWCTVQFTDTVSFNFDFSYIAVYVPE